MFLLKNLQQRNAVKFTGIPFGSSFCTVTESNIHVKSCKVHMKSSLVLKNIPIENLLNYFSLCIICNLFIPFYYRCTDDEPCWTRKLYRFYGMHDVSHIFTNWTIPVHFNHFPEVSIVLLVSDFQINRLSCPLYMLEKFAVKILR